MCDNVTLFISHSTLAKGERHRKRTSDSDELPVWLASSVVHADPDLSIQYLPRYCTAGSISEFLIASSSL